MSRSRELALVTVLALVWAAIITWLGWLRVQTFQSPEFEDEALYHQMLWAVGQGTPFENTIHPLHRPSHWSPVTLLVWPLYAAFSQLGSPHVAVALVQALALASGAFVVRLLVRAVANATPADVFRWVTVYLLFPPTLALALSPYRPLLLAVPALLLVGYGVVSRRLGLTLLGFGAAVVCREDLALVALPLALVAWLRHRDLRFVLWPLGLALAWYLVVTRAVLPAILPAGYEAIVVQSNLATDGVGALLARPFERTHLVALLLLVVPLLGLPVLAWESLLGATGVAAIALYKGGFAMNVVHFATPAVPAVLVGAIVAWGRHRKQRPWLGAAVLGAVLLTHAQPWLPPVFATDEAHNGAPDATLPGVGTWSPFAPARFQPDVTGRWELLALIPPDAPVAAVGHLLPALSPRARLFELGHADTPFLDVTWVALEARHLYRGAGDYLAFDPPAAVCALAALRGAFHVERASGDLTLLRRAAEPANVRVLEAQVRACRPQRATSPDARRGVRSPGASR